MMITEWNEVIYHIYLCIYVFLRSEVFSAVTINVTTFWHVTKCNLPEIYRCFGGTCCVHLQGRRV